MSLKDKGEIGDCVGGDEYDDGATSWFKEEDVKEAIEELKELFRGSSNWNFIANEIDKIFGDLK